MSRQWLKCRVSNGMFSNERMINICVRGNGSIEEFVPEDTVAGEGDDGRVEVVVISREGGQWAVLPTSYRRSIPVEDHQLLPA